MEENNEVLEQEAEVSEEVSDAFDEDWDDVSDESEGFDLEDEDEVAEEEDGDAQPESDESEETESETEEPRDEGEEGNQLFKINYLGKEEQLTLEQMTELAQKGRDYDHVRQERDDLKGKTGRQLDFLKKLADKAGVSVDEQIDLTEAMWLMDEEAEKGNTLSEAEALLRVQKNRKQAPTEEQPAEKGTNFNPQIDRFLKVYPDVKADDIPQEVWASLQDMGGDLLLAYQTWLIKSLKAESAKAKQTEQNTKNKQRSTGSLNNAGAKRKKDEFDEGWFSL